MVDVPAGPGKNDEWGEYYDHFSMNGPNEPLEFKPEISINAVVANIENDIKDKTFDSEYDYCKKIKAYVKKTIDGGRGGLLTQDQKNQTAILYRGIAKAVREDMAMGTDHRLLLLMRLRACIEEFQRFNNTILFKFPSL
jgi:hypothetical protein